MTSETYKQGDVIGGKYEILNTLGKGGFGVVYHVRVRLQAIGATGNVFVEEFAVKTFLDKWMADSAVRDSFKKEALVWVNLNTHPCILAAQCVDEVSGRLFVQMEYVPADAQGRVTLADHLDKSSRPLPLNQTLTWAIQFCLGMEHAVAHGVKCHRDIKPGNILISQEGVLKISDFGLAVAAEKIWHSGSVPLSAALGSNDERFRFGVIQSENRGRCGTPGYMPPEVYRGGGADIRSDIYSFGLVLWQMATGSSSTPFSAVWRGDGEKYMRAVYEQQVAGRIPPVDGQLDPVIDRCLRANPAERFGSFLELRLALDRIFQTQVGRKFELPQNQAETDVFWNNQGISLNALGRHSEAIISFNKALAIDSQNSLVWNNKGIALNALGQHGEAILCYEKALAIDPRIAQAWCNKGSTLHILGRFEDAVVAFEKALALNPNESNAWNNKANALQALGRHREAIACYDKILAVDTRDTKAWNNKGNALNALGMHKEGFACYDQALAIDPLDTNAWNGRGGAYKALGRHSDAIACYDKVLEINPQRADVWCSKGTVLHAKDRHAEALQCFDKAVALDPKDMKSWCNRGVALKALGRLGEAVASYDKALQIDPRDAKTWFNKANTLAAQERYQDALVCFQEADKLGDQNAAKYVEQCRSLLRKDEDHFERGFAFYQAGNFEEAIHCYDAALAVDASNPDIWINRGAAMLGLERDADALACFEKALSIRPDNATAWNNKGRVLLSLERFKEALAAFDRALEVNPAYANAWFGKGQVLANFNRHEDMIKCCVRALEINPQDGQVWILKGQGFYSMKRYQDAIQCLQQAEKLGDESAAGFIAYCRRALGQQ